MNTSNEINENENSIIYNIGSRVWNSAKTVTTGLAIAGTIIAGSYILGGCDKGKATKEELNSVVTNVRQTTEDMKNSNKKVVSAVKKAQDEMVKDLDERVTPVEGKNQEQDTALENHGQAIKKVEDTQKDHLNKLKETRAVTEDNKKKIEDNKNKTEGNVAGIQDNKNKTEANATGIKQNKKEAESLADKLVDSSVGRKFKSGEYTLMVKPIDDNQKRYTLLKGTNPIQIVDIEKYNSGAVLIQSAVDANGNGIIEKGERKGGIYTATDAKFEVEKLDALLTAAGAVVKKKEKEQIEGKPKKSSPSVKSEFEEIVQKLAAIGSKPSYGTLDDDAIETFRLFNAAEAFGSYGGERKVIISEKYKGNEEISIIKKVSGNEYIIMSGNEKVSSISFGKAGEVLITDYMGGAPAKKTFKVSEGYTEDLELMWFEGNQTGKSEYISEEKRKEAEEKAEIRADKRAKTYKRGARLRVVSDGDKSHTVEGEASYGTERTNFKVRGAHIKNHSKDSVQNIDDALSIGGIEIDYELGPETKGTSTKRSRITLASFLQGRHTDSELFGTDPVLSTDGSGRFDTVEEFFGGEREQDSIYGSGSAKLTLDIGHFLKLTGFGGYDIDRISEDHRVTITDTTGVIANPIVNDINADVTTRVNLYGGELLGGLKMGESMLLGYTGFKMGSVSIDDHMNPETEIDISELAAGGYLNLRVLDGLKVTAGGIWSMSDVDGDRTHFGRLTAGSTFSLGDNIVVSPFGVAYVGEGDKPRWAGSMVTAFGGSGNSEENVNAIDEYQLGREIRAVSGEHSSELRDIINRSSWNDLVRNLDSHVVFGGDIEQIYDKDGKSSAAGSARLAMITNVGNGKYKLSFEPSFATDGTGYALGAGVQLSHKNFYARLGYTNTSTDMKMGNDDDQHFVGFEMGVKR